MKKFPQDQKIQRYVYSKCKAISLVNRSPEAGEAKPDQGG
jgi:hypothetical protein